MPCGASISETAISEESQLIPGDPTHSSVTWGRQNRSGLWYRESHSGSWYRASRSAVWRCGEAGVSLDLQRFAPDAYLASRFTAEITGPEDPSAIDWSFLVGLTETSPPLLELAVGDGISLSDTAVTVTISADQIDALGTGGFYCELWDDTNTELVGRYFLPIRRAMRPPPVV